MKRHTKAEQARADAAWLANQQTELPVEIPPAAPTVRHEPTVPFECPTCLKAMTVASGWTLVFGDLLQCGNCGVLIQVPRAEYEKHAKLIHDHFARLNAPIEKSKRGPRVRGAG